MSQDPLVEKLIKAGGDVKKLCDFFAARKGWILATDAVPPAQDFSVAAKTLDEHVKALIKKCGSEPAEPARPEADLLPVGALDGARLGRFTTFLRDLDSWFEAQSCQTDSPEGTTALLELESNLACVIAVIEAVSASHKRAVTENPPAPHEPATGAAEFDNEGGETNINLPDGVPLQLVLDDTDELPLLQDFQNITELTPKCQELIDEFLAAWKTEYSYYNRKKLFERILRWISSAPEGQVLVIKMKTVEEPIEPYPSYVSRDVLAGRVPPEES